MKTSTLLFLIVGAVPHAIANNVGNWDLSTWTSSLANSYSSPTVQSNGSEPVGLSTSYTSASSLSLAGNSDGSTSTVALISVPPSATYSYSYTQSFAFGIPVDFGSSVRQKQFGTPPDNGFGLQVDTEETGYISFYEVTIQLSGGGVFTTFNGTPAGFGNAAGVGTATVTLSWANPNPTSGSSVFGGIAISGPVTGISVSVQVTYENDPISVLSPINVVKVKLNNAPPLVQPPTLRINGRKSVTTSARSLTIRGSASDPEGDLARVEAKAGRLPYRTARGRAAWSFRVRGLKPGRNTVLARAVDSVNHFSRVARVIITRS